MSSEDTDQGTTDVHDGLDFGAHPGDAAIDDTDLIDDTEHIDDRGELVESGAEIAAGDTDDPVPTKKRKLDVGLLMACFVIAGGLVLIGWGLLTAQTGDDGIDRPEAIENMNPVENALQVLQQETIMVDLDFGYEAELILDGIELEITRIGEIDLNDIAPGEQVATPPTAVFDPGNSRIEFRPSPGAQIEELTEGRHTATVIYWLIEEGRDNARSYTWSFDVI